MPLKSTNSKIINLILAQSVSTLLKNFGRRNSVSPLVSSEIQIAQNEKAEIVEIKSDEKINFKKEISEQNRYALVPINEKIELSPFDRADLSSDCSEISDSGESLTAQISEKQYYVEETGEILNHENEQESVSNAENRKNNEKNMKSEIDSRNRKRKFEIQDQPEQEMPKKRRKKNCLIS
jgi:hypothetical protein